MPSCQSKRATSQPNAVIAHLKRPTELGVFIGSRVMKLREYQQQAVDAVLQHFRQSDQAAVIVLPTGAGKSLVIAELARLANYPILVLAHVKELVAQNQAKFQHYGLQSGVYAAGLGRKEAHFSVTFASVQSLSRNLEQFQGYYSLVIIDECHRLSDDSSSQYQRIIAHLRQRNPPLKVLGLTATPYRLDKGWIYQQHYHGYVRTCEPVPFFRCIYELPLRYLIKRGYLTQPLLIDAPAARYQFDELPEVYTDAELDSFLNRYPRVTQAICQQLMVLAETRKGVMIFAATVKHAHEIAGYLPAAHTALITGDTPAAERDTLIAQFKQQTLKFLVNVSVLTTGFDAPHVDVIALLRRTASVSLYQQIVGRGLRLFPGKSDCLVIDYAGNGFDLYQPEIGEIKPNPNARLVTVPCPLCAFANTFWGLVDGEGDLIEHYGRRCQGLVDGQDAAHPGQQCDYRFKFKLCPYCQAENDIAARQCHRCGQALIDPDRQLKEALQLKDRKVLRCSGLSANVLQHQLVLTYHDEDGAELSERFDFEQPAQVRRFHQIFSRTHTGSPLHSASAHSAAETLQQRVAPDFVIARQGKRYWAIEHRIFDYQGPYRKAHQVF